MDTHGKPALADQDLIEVSGGTLGAAISDGLAVGGSTGLNSTVSPTHGYGNGNEILNDGSADTSDNWTNENDRDPLADVEGVG